VRSSPNGDGAVFGKAVGGNENTQFFWMKPDGTGIKELTNIPAVRHNFGGWSDDGKRIYYASNKRDKNYFDVYSMEVASGKEELIYRQNGNNDFAAASKDGKRIIISRSGTELSLDNNLYLVDVKTKQETLLTPHEGSSQYGDVHFITNDEIEFTTNDKREFMSLARMSLDGKVIRVLQDSEWDLDTIVVSRNNNASAHIINREGFSELDVYKAKKRGKDSVKLPAQGIVSGLTFSSDGNKLAFSFAGAKYNADVWIYNLNSKSLTQVTKSDRAGIRQESFIEPKLIKYKTFDGKEIPAWFYRPAGWLINTAFYSGNGMREQPQKARQFPIIVSVHGGP
jgi:dipeptidyl aminopeptidase/acylaminoacyl peptidase